MKLEFILLLTLTLFSSACSSQSKYKNTDHYDGKIFFMPGQPIASKSFFDVLKWKLKGSGEDWPDEITPPVAQTKPAPTSTDKGIVTFINHATFLVQIDGLNFLTDPIWSKRASPLSFAGPSRVHEPGVAFENLPKIDFVIISHNHYDHMDSETIRVLENKFSPIFIVPLANFEKMKSFGATKVIELDWWGSTKINPDFKVTLTPSQHWSARGLWDKCEALWGAFFIESKKIKIYFAGDTGYGPHFKEIFTKLGAPDLALLPIGAYEPRWFMKDAHMNPEEAVLAHIDLQVKHSIGMHFGTFKLSSEAIDTPLKDLQMAKQKLSISNFTTLVPGASQEF